MQIETLATGDEVVSGDVIDSNSALVSKKLMSVGILTTRHQCVGDDLEQIKNELLTISKRADACVVIGGLGPTEDDLTAQAAALASGVPLALNEEAIARMRDRAAKMRLRFSDKNIQSAMIPKAARVLQTEVGTAPGFQLKMGKCEFFFFPGPPSEFQFFVERDFIPWVEAQPRGQVTVTQQYKTLGWAEAHLAEQFDDFKLSYPQLKVGYRVHAPEVWLKLTATAANKDQALALIAPAERQVMERVGATVFGQGDEELSQMVHELLRERGIKLAVAESCTGGLLSSWITGHAGSSDYFYGGVVSYSNDAKEKLLNVSPDLLMRHGAVSAPVAQAMAEGALTQFGSDLSVAITGIAGPGGGSSEKPVGLVYLALAAQGTQPADRKVIAVKRNFRGDRARVRRASALTALDMIRRHVLNLPDLTDGQA